MHKCFKYVTIALGWANISDSKRSWQESLPFGRAYKKTLMIHFLCIRTHWIILISLHLPYYYSEERRKEIVNSFLLPLCISISESHREGKYRTTTRLLGTSNSSPLHTLFFLCPLQMYMTIILILFGFCVNISSF